jgi:quinohemoprotein ethanol dehydrogenase
LTTGRPIEVPEARYKKGAFVVMPSALGAHNWHPMAFSPQTGLVYLPAQEVPMQYSSQPGYKYNKGAWNIAVDALALAPPNDPATYKALRAMLKGQLVAWDPVAQKEVWRAQYDGPWNGGVLTTAGNLVFQGNAKGKFQAFDAKTGKPLWGFDAQTGVIAGPVSFKVGDTQYVAVMAGYGGAYPVSTGFTDGPVHQAANGRVLVFKLGGTAKLPPADPIPMPPPNPPTTVFTEAQIKEGGAIFENNCGLCHGAGARSGGLLPDLRRSHALNDPAAWQAIVHDGALKANGMVPFGEWFSAAQIEAIRGYVGQQAKVLATGEPTTAGVTSK